MRVLFVDDDAFAHRTLKRFCLSHPTARHWTRAHVESPHTVLAKAAEDVGLRADVIATDMFLGAAVMNALDLVRTLRASGLATPILIYSARNWTEWERAHCLRAGADDVMHMPFTGLEEFVARIERLGRRNFGGFCAAGRIAVGDLIIDPSDLFTVRSGRGPISLTPTSRALLAILAAMAPRPVRYTELLAAMGYEIAGNRHTVTEAVRQLRAKLSGTSVRIESVAGFGYQLVIEQVDSKRPTRYSAPE